MIFWEFFTLLRLLPRQKLRQRPRRRRSLRWNLGPQQLWFTFLFKLWDWTGPILSCLFFSAVACAFRDYPMKCLSGFVKIGFLGRVPNYVRKVGTNHSRFSPLTSFDSMPVRTTPAWPRVRAYRQKPMASTGLLKSLGETAVSRLKWKEPQTETNQALLIHRTARFNVETNAKKKPNEHNSQAGPSLWNHTQMTVLLGAFDVWLFFGLPRWLQSPRRRRTLRWRSPSSATTSASLHTITATLIHLFGWTWNAHLYTRCSR